MPCEVAQSLHHWTPLRGADACGFAFGYVEQQIRVDLPSVLVGVGSRVSGFKKSAPDSACGHGTISAAVMSLESGSAVLRHELFR